MRAVVRGDDKMRPEAEVRARLKTLMRQYGELEKGELNPVSHFDRALRRFSLRREIAQLYWVLCEAKPPSKARGLGSGGGEG